MIVTDDYMDDALRVLSRYPVISLDTETTGLRPYHGDTPFAIVIGYKDGTYYFDSRILPRIAPLKGFLARHKFQRVYMHNAKFDLAMLAADGYTVASPVFDTKIMARLVYNDKISGYDLASCAKEIGEEKDTTVEKYIQENHLYTHIVLEHKSQKDKLLHYDRVPVGLMGAYAEKDAEITFRLGEHYSEILTGMHKAFLEPSGKSVHTCLNNEMDLIPIIHAMSHRGAKINTDYCQEAIDYEKGVITDVELEFEKISGEKFKISPKLFKDIFTDEQWEYNDMTPTGKVNPDFSNEALEKFKSPLAKEVIRYRKAKANLNYFRGFLYHADANGFIHTNFNQDGTTTGRFSSSSPNLQNLSKSDENPDKYPVRRAIIPIENHLFAMFDMDQAEYRLMLDYACRLIGYESDLVKKIKAGLDVHQATAEIAGISRKAAKSANFCILYGGGDNKLAEFLSIPKSEAQNIKSAIFSAAPEIQGLIRLVSQTAERRGFIHNWLGRVYRFENADFSYKSTNTLIQGGVADIIKVGMVKVDRFLKEKNLSTRLVLNIHDELVYEVHPAETTILPDIKSILESVYPYTYLPMTFGCDHSFVSLEDKIKGFPV